MKCLRLLIFRYTELLQECQQCYLTQRAQVIWSGVEAAVKELTDNHKGDHCTLMRTACSFLIHISQDEWDLFLQFFSKSSPLLMLDYLFFGLFYKITIAYVVILFLDHIWAVYVILCMIPYGLTSFTSII